jgi:hypothetical protein
MIQWFQEKIIFNFFPQWSYIKFVLQRWSVCDRDWQLLSQSRQFSLDTPASSITKTACTDSSKLRYIYKINIMKTKELCCGIWNFLQEVQLLLINNWPYHTKLTKPFSFRGLLSFTQIKITITTTYLVLRKSYTKLPNSVKTMVRYHTVLTKITNVYNWH